MILLLTGLQMRILGIETSCDETSAAVVEETGDAAKPWAIRSNVDRVAGADPPRVGRRRAGARVAAAHSRHLRRRRARARRGGATWRDLGAIAVTQGPGLVGSLLVGVSFAKAARPRRACRWSPFIISPATSNRSSCRTARCRCRPSCWSSRAATPACISSSARARTSCSAARATMRRARRTTRWRSCSASAIRAGR